MNRFDISCLTLVPQVVEAATGEGAALLDHWFVGCHASHVVCEGPSVQRYIGHTNNLVTVRTAASCLYCCVVSYLFFF